jgi:hypothetical protein
VRQNPVARLVLRFFRGMRFPQLFLVFATLFAVDFVVPDFIPFADELLLGLGTLLVGAIRKRRDERAIDVTPR